MKRIPIIQVVVLRRLLLLLVSAAAWLFVDDVSNVVVVAAFITPLSSSALLSSRRGRISPLRSDNDNNKYIPPSFTVIDDDDDDGKYEDEQPSSAAASSKDQQASRRPATHPPPPEFIVEDYEEEGTRPSTVQKTKDADTRHQPSNKGASSKMMSSTTSTSSDYEENEEEERAATTTTKRKRRRSVVRPIRPKLAASAKKSVDAGASWMTRNAEFESSAAAAAASSEPPSEQQPFQQRPQQQQQRQQRSQQGRNSNDNNNDRGDRSPRRRDDDRRINTGGRGNKTFRQDFRGTRVFVQGLPPHATWQDLKDHFRNVLHSSQAVVFASVSTDPMTGTSKGHGIVQFETTELAATAVALAGEFPFAGKHPPLFVRPDRQEGRDDARLKRNMPQRQQRVGSPNNSNNAGPPPPPQHSDWVCADEENAHSYLGEEDRQAVLNLINARNDARRRRNYDVSDNIRQELKDFYGVHLDDRLHTWWTSMDGKDVPQKIRDIRGESGRWGKHEKAPWRQIPTTPENDALVNPDLVFALLQQRDIARAERDFATADALLEEARAAPDDADLYLRIHDESRTWRIWTTEPPPKPISHHHDNDNDDNDSNERAAMSPGDQCIAIVQEHAPNRVGEIRMLLDKFKGREYNILKKLKKRYL